MLQLLSVGPLLGLKSFHVPAVLKAKGPTTHYTVLTQTGIRR
jgi:hypothetical protein